MSEAGKSSESQPATVLVDIQKKHLHVLNEIIKLVDPEMQPDILHIVPKEILLDMIRFKPDSEIRIIECINKVNGVLLLIPEFLKGKTWKDIMGFEYVMKNGIQREEHRPFSGCPRDVPDHTPSSQLGYIKDFVRLNTINKALIQLKKHPIGAALAIFQPEYKNIGKKIYRGPVSQYSKLRYMHAVSLMEVSEENGEKYVLARISHGEKFGDGGYIKISLEVVILYIPISGEDVDENTKKYFSKPRSLLGRFS
ncbi:hypothetical protein N665_0979s0009 [Sinapis alba]|nr:hypothetical protein N665_0979s0009 [Sinapis alba]